MHLDSACSLNTVSVDVTLHVHHKFLFNMTINPIKLYVNVIQSKHAKDVFNNLFYFHYYFEIHLS